MRSGRPRTSGVVSSAAADWSKRQVLLTVVLVPLWRPRLAGTVNAEIAAAEGQRPERARIAFTLVMAFVIAIATKIDGILLNTRLSYTSPSPRTVLDLACRLLLETKTTH